MYKKIKEKLLLLFYLKEPIEWKNKLTWWYKLSCLTPTLLGLYIKYYKLDDLKQYGNHPWNIQSTILICNGLLSYIGDVITFGNYSLWKIADIICTCVNVVLCTSIIPRIMSNHLKFSSKMLVILSIVSFISLFFKTLASKELTKGIKYSYYSHKYFILYHSMWHYIMCGGCLLILKFLC
jgi:hypothetical protein